MIKFLISFFFLLMSVPLALWRAFVVQKLWVWFATPAFGITAPSIILIWGLFWLVAMFDLPKPDNDLDNQSDEKYFKKLIYGFFYTFVITTFGLFAGWLIQLFA